MKMLTIVYVHPWDGSYSHAELMEVTKRLKERNQDYTLIDLYADGFNPVMTADDLSGYSRGLSKDPLVDRYIEIVKATDKMIVLFPVWWDTMPAMLKGFFDKVFLPMRVIEFINKQPVSHSKLSKALLLTTSEYQTTTLAEEKGDPIHTILDLPLGSIGAKKILWHNFGDIIIAEKPALTAYLSKVGGFVDELLD